MAPTTPRPPPLSAATKSPPNYFGISTDTSSSKKTQSWKNHGPPLAGLFYSRPVSPSRDLIPYSGTPRAATGPNDPSRSFALQSRDHNPRNGLRKTNNDK